MWVVQLPTLIFNMKVTSEELKTIIFIERDIEEGLAYRIVSEFNWEATEIDVYISSIGGSAFEVDKLIKLIEDNFETINVYACGNLLSAAFYLFFKINAKKRELIGKSLGMFHKSTWDHVTSHGLKRSPYETAKISHIKELNDDQKEFCKTVLKFTDKELSLIYDDEEDVYFDNNRLLEFIKNRDDK